MDTFDEREALHNVGGDKDILGELAHAFLTQCPKLIADAQLAISRQDAAKVRIAAHTLKGSAAIFAAKSVVQASQRLETIAAEGNLNEAAQALAAVENLLPDLTVALARFVPEMVR